MENSPDQFCGYCGKAREPGENACPYCGNSYSEAYAGSPGNTQAPTKPTLTDMARRATQTSQGNTPPPQYSGVMPPVSPPSDNTSSPNYFGGMPNHFGAAPFGGPPLNIPPGMPTPKADKKSLPLRKIIIAQGVAIILLLVVLIVVLLVRGNTVPGITSTPTATATPTALATPTPIPTATNTPAPTATATLVPTPGPLCPDVGTWSSGSPDWKPANGVLLNDGSNGFYLGGPPTIVAPCQLGATSNYAVETKIQVISITRGAACFGITVRGSTTSDGWQGYQAAIEGGGACHTLYGALDDASISAFPSHPSVPFNPGTTVHTYRVEVNGNVIKFLIDGAELVSLTDNRYLSGAQVGLWDGGVQLQVTSFQVTLL